VIRSPGALATESGAGFLSFLIAPEQPARVSVLTPRPGHLHFQTRPKRRSTTILYSIARLLDGFQEDNGVGDFRWDVEGGLMSVTTVARTAFIGLLLATFAFASEKTPHTYQKGTISGWESRTDIWGAGFFGTDAQGVPRKVTVFELKGADMIYLIDYCGAFQEGQFGLRQAVDYRLEGDRLYVRRDNGKEFKCKIEGQKTLEPSKNDATLAKP
jgi:hypothetical protein